MTSRRVHFDVDQDRNLLVTRLEGVFELDDWLGVIQSLSQVEGYRPGMDALYLVDGARFDFSQDDILTLQAWIQDRIGFWGSGWRYATVAAEDVTYGTSRMIAAWFDDAEFESRVFRTEKEAMDWLSSPRP